MNKVCQRTQPLSCSRHKRNGCKAQAQAALPTMMSGFDGCLRADVTWVGSREKEGESFHVCFSAAQCWLGTVAEQGSAWSASIYIYRTRAIIIPWAFIFSSHSPGGGGGASIRERALFERGLYFFNRRTQLHDRIFFTMTCWWKDDAPIYR